MINNFLDIQKILLEQFKQLPFYHRAFFKRIHLNNRMVGIVGPRGVGKTTFLLHQILELEKQQQEALYISADNIYFLDQTLLGLVDYLYKETDIRVLCIDEIHKYANWNQELKNIFDTYLDFRIIFTGSSAIDLVHSTYDLSRRVVLYNLEGFSFREYLELTYQYQLPILKIEEIVNNHLKISQKIEIPKILKYFKDYLKSGYYPFFGSLPQDYERFHAIENITMKTIYEDIANFHSLKTQSLLTIEKLFKYVLQSLPGEISAYKLANTLGKDFESITLYLEYLRQAGLVRYLYPKKTGHAFIRNPIKIYPENTNLMHANFVPYLQDSLLGKTRETFIINQLQNTNFTVYYHEIADFSVEDWLFEVGGASKTNRQIKNQENAYILADGVVIGEKRKIPLYLFGFLY